MFRATDTLIASKMLFDDVGYRITSDGVTADVLLKFKQKKSDRVFRVVVEKFDTIKEAREWVNSLTLEEIAIRYYR